MARRFEIKDKITRRYSRFNATGNATITPSNARDPVSHFLASVNDYFEHAVQNLSDSNMVE